MTDEEIGGARQRFNDQLDRLQEIFRHTVADIVLRVGEPRLMVDVPTLVFRRRRMTATWFLPDAEGLAMNNGFMIDILRADRIEVETWAHGQEFSRAAISVTTPEMAGIMLDRILPNALKGS